MNDNQESVYYEDVIDLRELVQTLLEYKWVILGSVVLSALAAFVVSAFVLPPQYQATSYVNITEPIIRAELDPSIQVSPSFPDTGALAELAEADAIVDQVSVDLDLETYFDEDEPELEAALQGQNQLRLRVTADDPERAADIANAWAGIVVQRLNDLYGTGEKTLSTLESEVANAKAEWDAAQNSLQEYLPESRVEVLTVRLAEKKTELAANLTALAENRMLISDARRLQSQLSELDQDEALDTASALSLITLQQKASGESASTQFQLPVQDLLGENFPVSGAVVYLENFVSTLQDQSKELEIQTNHIEQQITELSVALEEEQFKIEQLTQERDLARSAYTALANQLEETRITQAQEERSAKIGANAVKPDKKSGPGKLRNTLLSGMAGGILAIGVIIVFDWWNNGTREN